MDSDKRELVLKRANGYCEYCRLPQKYFAQSFHVEHIIPKQHRGSDDVTNLALACSRCNFHKGPNISGLDPNTNELTPIFNPRNDRWEEHFSNNEDGEIAGLSAVGRTTIYVLNMNAERRMKIRAAIALL